MYLFQLDIYFFVLLTIHQGGREHSLRNYPPSLLNVTLNKPRKKSVPPSTATKTEPDG